MLRDVAARNRDALSRRGANLTAHCTRFAGGVKLKLVERDLLFGNDGNALAVAAALGRQGYNVLLLHRTNHLDSLLGRMSRKRTGVLHCKKEKAEMCKKSLNTSFVLSCARARDAIDRTVCAGARASCSSEIGRARSMAPAPCCVWSMSASLAARERGSRRCGSSGCLTTMTLQARDLLLPPPQGAEARTTTRDACCATSTRSASRRRSASSSPITRRSRAV